MLSVYYCVTEDHDLRLVALAALVCACGCWITVRLFGRACRDVPGRRAGWLFLTGVAAGGSVWCTHFIAMLGYIPGANVDFDPKMTAASFFVSIFGQMLGFAIAVHGRGWHTRALGGAIMGLAIAAMHFIGMQGYEVEGYIVWDSSLVHASVVAAVVLGAAALSQVGHPSRFRSRYLSALLLLLDIVLLHFTAMTAVEVVPFEASEGLIRGVLPIAMSICAVGLLIVGMGVVSHLLDRSLQHESSAKLRRMALYDHLTGLPNRVEFSDRLEQAIERSEGGGRKVAYLSIDLDRFKTINDQFGYQIGDKALVAFAWQVSGVLRDGEVLARTGGDEFALMSCFSNRSDLDNLLDRIDAALEDQIRVANMQFHMDVSVGVAVLPDDAADAERLAVAADLAMYRAKSDPGRRVVHFDPSFEESAARKRQLAIDLRHAIELDQLLPYYQIQKDVRTGRTLGFEALLRWKHPDLGFVPPSEFIPLAEETGKIAAIGEWMLRRACADAARWPEAFTVSVNISPVQFAQDDLELAIEQALWNAGLPAERLQIEITESALMSNVERTVEILHAVKRLGVSVALDDFGAGYSSLATLWAFPFDVIKLDRSFILGLEHGDNARAIIRAVIGLAENLGVTVLAEGVETETQRDCLLQEGCYEVQGYLYGRPLPVEECDFSIEVTTVPAIRRTGAAS